MNWKTFEPEQLVKIRQNKYVKSATPKMIRFTVAFKQEFWEQYNKGMPPSEIMRSMGFDTDVLGETRISGITQHIKEQVRSGTGFRDVRATNLISSSEKQNSPSKAMLRMQCEIEYMKQELEFIKKIILADKGAKQKCL